MLLISELRLSSQNDIKKYSNQCRMAQKAEVIRTQSCITSTDIRIKPILAQIDTTILICNLVDQK